MPQSSSTNDDDEDETNEGQNAGLHGLHPLSTRDVPQDWVEIQLSPLTPAYKSSWTGNEVEVRLAASTQSYFPPGFINS